MIWRALKAFIIVISTYTLHQILDPRSCIFIPCPDEPPGQGEERNEASDADRVVHVNRCNRPYWWKEEYHADEAHPAYCDEVDRLAPAAQSIRPVNKSYAMFVNKVGDDDGDIGKIKSGCGDVEDSDNGL